MRKIWIILAVLVLFGLFTTVSAQEIKFNQDCDVSVIYLGTDAGYSNYFGWVSGTPPVGVLNQLGQGHVTAAPTTFNIGSRFANENIILYIKNDLGEVFYSDPSTANPDGVEHVSVTPIDPTAVLVTIGWEDLLGGGDQDFNDIYVQVQCTPTQIPVPEFPSMALPVALIIGMLGTILFIQSSRKN